MIFSFEVLEVCKLSGYVMLALGLAVLEERKNLFNFGFRAQ